MGESKLGHTVRAAIKAVFGARTKRHMPSAARFTPVAAKTRLSKRGQPGDTWNTKKWTAARVRMRDEELKARMERDRREKAASKAGHIERHA